ncbi:MAG: DEAD/DEAH box helicase [bacterium]
MSAVLDLFHPLIGKWFAERFGSPTGIQELAWPAIARGEHVLITAPTGSGKTLAAFLWAINRLVTSGAGSGDARILYVSPLKALNNDIRRNLEEPLSELASCFRQAGEPFPPITIAVRSGDTEPAERRRMVKAPPEILITTPESLNVLLTSGTGRRSLLGLRSVILDEIHAVAPNKRGTYLMSAVERLVRPCGEFQRLALSATVRPLETVAGLVGGWKRVGAAGAEAYERRPVTILETRGTKRYEVCVVYPEGAGERGDPRAWWSAIAGELRKIIERNRSTLLFTNSRRMTEKLTRLLNESASGDRVYSHHGSLSREIRAVVEKRFKEGELAAVVATGSLELGIDIGTVDEVVLVQVPSSIASSVQRMGRSGHGVGEPSRATFCPLHSRDFLEAAVLAAHMDPQEIEPVRPLLNPLDVLAQVVLSMVVDDARSLDEIYAEVRTSWAYHELPRKEFDLVVEMLAGRYEDARLRELRPRAALDRIDGTLRAREGAARLLFLSGGVIPDRGYYNLRLADSRAKIAELDEEFVWERRPGDAFPLGNQLWSIQRITANDVEVLPAPRASSVIPFWRSEEMDRPFHFSERIGVFLEAAEAELGTRSFREKLLGRHRMSRPAADHLIGYLQRQREATGAPLPHRHHLLVEHFRDPSGAEPGQTVLHTLWGGSVNRPLALALAAAWETRYETPLQTFANNDAILVHLPKHFTLEDLLPLVAAGKLDRLLRARLESTAFFGARFRENAQRALLLPRRSFRDRMPLWLNRVRARKLLEAVSRYPDFPIVLETWRTCMDQEFDLPVLERLLEEIRTRAVRLTEVIVPRPSPFAEAIVWTRTNQLMYEDDAPGSGLRTSLSEELLRQALRSGRLRPRLSGELIHAFQQKVQRVAEGYAPSTPDDLLEWVKERRLIPGEEWTVLLEAVERDSGLQRDEILAPISGRLAWIPRCPDRAIVALEDLERTCRALGDLDSGRAAAGGPPGRREPEPETAQESAGSDELLTAFLAEWLRFYGPVSHPFVLDRLGIEEARLAAALDGLIESRTITVDVFRAESGGAAVSPPQQEICDTENLEILLRLQRAARRPSFTALESDALPLFLAAYQGLTGQGDGADRLQQRLEQLFGYPARAVLWETEILPARLSPYHPSWLDSAMSRTELAWFGCGKERLGFCFRPDLELFVDPGAPANGETAPDAQDRAALTRRVEEVLAGALGRVSLADLSAAPQLKSVQLDLLANSLWELAWQGRVLNDSFETVRRGVLSRFRAPAVSDPVGDPRRSRLSRWRNPRPLPGNWFVPRLGRAEPRDALETEELSKDRARVLLARYGVLFRELLANELPPLRWPSLLRTLRLMELAGEVLAGHFFQGIPGLQFCSHEAFRLLEGALPEETVYWMNAADPASMCGTDLEELKGALPPRLSTTHLVFHGRRLVVVSKRSGAELEIRVQPDHPQLHDFLGFMKVVVGRRFAPLRHLRVETVNGGAALESPYAGALADFGFQRELKGLTLRRRF